MRADVACGLWYKEYCQHVAFRTPRGDVAVVITNDEITAGLVPGLVAPRLAKGAGRALSWRIGCGGRVVNGTLPWKAIQTVVIKC